MNASKRGKSHVHFRTQCVIMTLVGGWAITSDALKFRKVIESYYCYYYYCSLLLLSLPNHH